MTTRVTQSAVAKAANVSVPTVSKVLNGHRDVSAQTRARIEEAIDRTGYARQRSPQRPLRRGELVDLVINELDSSWSAEILAGIEQIAHESGLSLVLTAVHTRTSPGRRWLDSLTSRGSQGIVLVHSDLSRHQRAELASLNIPSVVVDAAGQTDGGTPSVGVTNRQGGFSAVNHLIRLGHQRIAMIGGPPRRACTKARVAGYRDALHQAGLKFDAALLRFGNFGYSQGLRHARTLLQLDRPPTAVFAGSDLQALGAYQAVHELRLRVPDDVSVVGFDDLPFARWTAPPLTTVRQPLREMGVLATRMLVTMVRRRELQVAQVELATELIVRDSTTQAPPRGRTNHTAVGTVLRRSSGAHRS